MPSHLTFVTFLAALIGFWVLIEAFIFWIWREPLARHATHFELGRIVATHNVDQFMKENGDHLSVISLISRHQSGDWGKICEEDAQLNELALKNGERIMSVYDMNGRDIWIITEADRSSTTLLFPEEY